MPKVTLGKRKRFAGILSNALRQGLVPSLQMSCLAATLTAAMGVVFCEFTQNHVFLYHYHTFRFIDFCSGNHPTLAGGGKSSEIGAVLRSLRSKGAAFRFLLVVDS